MTPRMNELSPTGRNDLGTTLNRYAVPARQAIQAMAEIQRLRRKNHSDRPYTFRTRCSSAPKPRSIHVFFAPAPRLPSNREVINGVRVSDTRPLARIEITIVIENS